MLTPLVTLVDWISARTQHHRSDDMGFGLALMTSGLALWQLPDDYFSLGTYHWLRPTDDVGNAYGVIMMLVGLLLMIPRDQSDMWSIAHAILNMAASTVVVLVGVAGLLGSLSIHAAGVFPIFLITIGTVRWVNAIWRPWQQLVNQVQQEAMERAQGVRDAG